MIRVLVVDDEMFVRERIKGCIDWESIEMNIVGETADGMEGLQKIEDLKPDIVVTDISMPCMNGLEFSKVIQKEYPEIKVVILTGYSNFDYAREAISAGVVQYLLKPINKSEMMSVMLELKGMIEKQRTVKNYVENLKKDSKKYYNQQRLEVFQTVVTQEKYHEDPALFRVFCKCFSKVETENIAIIIVEKENDQLGQSSPSVEQNQTKEREDLSLWTYAIINITNEIFEESMKTEILDENGERGILVVGCEPGIWEKCNDLALKASRCIKKYLGITSSMGISNLYESITDIPRAYQEAKSALRNKLILGAGQTIFYSDIQNTVGEIQVPVGIHSELLILMRMNNVKAIHDKIKYIFAEIQSKGMSIDNVYIVLSEVMLVLTEYTKEKNLREYWNIEGEHFVQDMIEKSNSLNEIETKILTEFKMVLKIHSKMNLQGYTGIMGKVKQYIDSNFWNKEMRLEDISSYAGISASYLSNIFKREAKISLNDYITQKRMKATKELLDMEDFTLSEIAEAVGFSDPYYLSKCFKKTYGVSPTKYKNG